MYQVPFEIPAYTYEDALARLRSTKRFGIQPLLESVQDMNAELGNPDDCFESVQVAGTNGKTSTARFTAAILAGEGLKTALYTSPELVSLTERMEVGGRLVPEAQFARGIAAAATAGERVNAKRNAAGERPYDITEFDLLTVAALVVFAEAGVDVAVLECGMGGRWDATSAARNIRSVAITGIGLDHMRILGDTLEKIAGEKAAIIKRGRTCVLGVGTATPASVEDVFLGQCAQEGVSPVLLRPADLADAAGEMHPGVPRAHAELPHASYRVTARPQQVGGMLALDVESGADLEARAGSDAAADGATARVADANGPAVARAYRGLEAPKPVYQAANIACAVVLAEQYLGRPLDSAKLRESVRACPTPGRFDLVQSEPPVLVDACHNPQSVGTFLAALDGVQPDVARRPPLLCAVLADKDVEGIVQLLAPAFAQVYVAHTSSDRALPAEELGRVFAKHGNEPVRAFGSIPEACAALRGTSYVACGSITTAGEVAGVLRPGVQGASR